jgi:hypothetical protein
MRSPHRVFWALSAFVLSACGPLRLGGDPRLLALSELQLRQSCRLEARMRAVAGSAEEKDFAGTCGPLLTATPNPESDAVSARKNLQAADANAMLRMDRWQIAVAKNRRAPAAEQLDLMRRQAVAQDEADTHHQQELAHVRETATALYASTVALRRNQADLHRCFALSAGDAWSQALRFNFKPVTTQCAVDVGVLQKQVKALDKVRKHLASADGAPQTPTGGGQ